MNIDERKIQNYLLFIKNNQQYFVNNDNGIKVITEAEHIYQSIDILKEKLAKEGKPPYWKNIGLVYEDTYLWFLCDIVKFQNNELNTHHRIIRKGGRITGVAILGKYNSKIVLLRHYRHPLRKEFIEIPRGGMIEGKSPDESIIQEIQEEFGGSLSRLEKMQIIHPSTSIDTASIQCYYGEYEAIDKPCINEGVLEIISMSQNEIEAAILSGLITDSVTICAYYQSVLNGYITNK